MNIGTLRVGVEVDAEKMGKGIESALTKARKGVNQLGKMFLGFGVASGAALLAVTKKASDLQETTSKFNTVFRGQIGLAENWAQVLVGGFGVSTEESKRFLSSIQDLLVPMGMARDAAGVLSNEVVKMAIDLGSFNNLPTEQVIGDIQSALVGNYETMKKYGVVLNATSVEQEIMNKGWATNRSEITQSMKAQAAYSLIVNGSTDAIGDFARTSGGYANQLKIMRAGIDDVIAKLGEAFLPIMIDVVNLINTELIPRIQEWVTEFNNSGEGAKWLADTLKFLISTITGVVAAFDLAAQMLAVFALALSGHFKEAKMGWEELKGKISEYGQKFEQISNFEIGTMERKESAKTAILNRESLTRTGLEKMGADKVMGIRKATTEKILAGMTALAETEKTDQEKRKIDFQAFTDGLGSSWAGSLATMMEGNINFEEGMKEIWSNITTHIIGEFSKLLAEEITSAMKSVAVSMYKAAAKVWSWAAGIPFAGPAIAAGVIATGYNLVKKHKFAEGIRNFTGGLAMVGERGPELVGLPRGSNVYTNRETKEIIREGGGEGDINIIINNPSIKSGEDWDRIVRSHIIPSLTRYKRKTRSSPFA